MAEGICGETGVVITPPPSKLTITENGKFDVSRYYYADVEVEGGGSASLQSKTATPTATAQIITPDEAFDGLSEVTVEAIPNEYVIPSGTSTITANGAYNVASLASVAVNVNSGDGYTIDDIAERNMMSGDLFGASASFIAYQAFYLASQLTGATFLSARTIGSYAFASCSRLKSISFPLATEMGERAFASCSALTEVNFPSMTNIGAYAFTVCTSLTTANFPMAASIGNNAFSRCSRLTNVTFPSATTISANAFDSCSRLASIDLPLAKTIAGTAFLNCTSLNTVSLPVVTSIGANAFSNCSRLVSFYMSSISAVPTLGATAFRNTPIGGVSMYAEQYGSIYVPASLYESFLTAANWSAYSSRIVSIQEGA